MELLFWVGGGECRVRFKSLQYNYNADSQSLGKKKNQNQNQTNKNPLGKKPGGTNFHENATKSSFTALRRFCRKVLLLVKVPLVWEAEPGGVVGETIVWLFPPTPPPNQFKCLNELESPRIKTYLL